MVFDLFVYMDAITTKGSVIYLDVYFYKFVLVYCLFNVVLTFNVY